MSSLHVLTDEDLSFFEMLGTHPTMLALYDAIRRAAVLDAPVLVSGPTGCGKELVARALHALSAAGRGPFCPVNVAALPEGLVESELFGNTRGAFTGAVADRRGLIEAAAGGTLFLDEASDLAAHAQAKLLRVLEDGAVRRVGAVGARVARFRLIAAIQVDPGALLRAGRWRNDFYYRITGIVLRVPPLAARGSDIALLARAYVRAHGLPEIEPRAMALLERHTWPGNVRELQRALVRATHHSGSGTITRGAVRAALEEADGEVAPAEADSLAAAKCRHVRSTVAACGGDTRRAAERLGISRCYVYRLLQSGSGPGADAPPAPGRLREAVPVPRG